MRQFLLELVQAMAIAALIAWPFVIYFLEMKP